MLKSLTKYINDYYGSKRGLLASINYKLFYMLGFYSSYQRIDFDKVSRLVFVCSGNICRSPFGEYMAKAKGLNAESFGLHCRGGDQADPRAINEARLRGADMNCHVTRNISEYTAFESDLILVMEPKHLVELRKLEINHAQITITSIWANNATPYLHDPFNTNDTFFGRSESIVEECVNKIHSKLF